MPYKDRAKRRAATRRWERAHPEYMRKYWQRYYAKHHEARLASQRRYYQNHREECLQRVKRYFEAHREQCRGYVRKHYRKLCAKFAVNPVAYARFRARGRVKDAMAAIRAGRKYKSRPWKRIPDWATFGQDVLDTRSQWLVENRSAGAAGWAREQAIENLEWRRNYP